MKSVGSRILKQALVLVPAALVLCMCARGDVLTQDLKLIRDTIQRARDNGALRCAPRELAMAESHAEFVNNELEQGDYVRAEAHVALASEQAKRALALADPTHCLTPKAPTIVRVDSDGDGLSDDVDACPKIPGAADNQGCPLKDSDGDTLFDRDDACPSEPGPISNKGCPLKDSDGDGVMDDVDRCPKEVGPMQNQGCPYPDSDGDGLIDPEDGCPKEAGPVSNKGCPVLDRDGDTVPDDVDACPDVPGDAGNRGCPKQSLVIVKDQQIIIKQQVNFQSGKAKILPNSFELLSQVAAVLRSNPAMRVQIQGHTDNRGKPAANEKLSQARADAVRSHLVTRESIEAARLTAQGLGQTKPITENRTNSGRAQNRRVEFHIQ